MGIRQCNKSVQNISAKLWDDVEAVFDDVIRNGQVATQLVSSPVDQIVSDQDGFRDTIRFIKLPDKTSGEVRGVDLPDSNSLKCMIS